MHETVAGLYVGENVKEKDVGKAGYYQLVIEPENQTRASDTDY